MNGTNNDNESKDWLKEETVFTILEDEGRFKRFSQFIEESSKARESDKDFSIASDLPYVLAGLNEKEKVLFQENRYVAVKVFMHATQAKMRSSSLYEDQALHNHNGDAFRHMFWNFLMTADSAVGKGWAKRWGDAHEEGTGNNPPLEKSMDLFNNEVGRQEGEHNPRSGEQELKKVVRSGGCRIIVGNKLVSSNSDYEK